MNIAEILKYCPKGTKLYSTIWGEVELNEVTNFGTIEIKAIDQIICTSFTLDYEGRYSHIGECVLFPSKDQRDWKKFKLPVKDGDIMMTIDKRAFITNGKIDNNDYPCAYCGINSYHDFTIGTTTNGWTALFHIPVSEEAKKELFDKMAEAGYRWNADTLELEKVEPKYRPFKDKEECWQEMQKHQPFGWIKASHGKFLIIGFKNNMIAFGINDNWQDYNYIFKSYIFADGTPFGIKEE